MMLIGIFIGFGDYLSIKMNDTQNLHVFHVSSSPRVDIHDTSVQYALIRRNNIHLKVYQKRLLDFPSQISARLDTTICGNFISTDWRSFVMFTASNTLGITTCHDRLKITQETQTWITLSMDVSWDITGKSDSKNLHVSFWVTGILRQFSNSYHQHELMFVYLLLCNVDRHLLLKCLWRKSSI